MIFFSLAFLRVFRTQEYGIKNGATAVPLVLGG
jgi:hypothetical protein